MMPTRHCASRVLIEWFYPSMDSRQQDTGSGTAYFPLYLGGGTASHTLHRHGSL